MGEVYRARDSKLGREVAIKVLPEELAQDDERLRRFQREARVLASLNHPNIAAIYGLERDRSTDYLVLELVEGETLAERVALGPIPVDEALPLFEQIAGGLEAAHEQGIIHRDLKPANIKIANSGVPKILDFGLAKSFLGGDGRRDDPSQSPTLTRNTSLGTIMGTAAYMSPEQARGRNVDRRADIWAFGCCLYEALTGRKPFSGETSADVIAKALETKPDLENLPTATPTTIRLLIRRCLEKDAEQRLRDIGDARLEIRETMSPPVNVPPPIERMKSTSQSRLSLPAAAAVALVSAAVAGIGTWGVMRISVERREPTRLILKLPNLAAPDAAKFGFSLFHLDLSSDGNQVVYVAEQGGERQLYLRSMKELSAKPLANTEGATAAFFSPDDRWVAFHAAGQLKRVAVDGSRLLTLCDAPGFAGASWGPDDAIVFAGTEGLFRVFAHGGPPELMVTPDSDAGEVLLGWPNVLPNGRDVLATVLTEGSIVDDPRARIVAVSLETGKRRLVVEAGSNPHYLPTGHAVYAWGGSLYAVEFDLERLAPTETPLPVVQGVRSDPFVGADFTVSPDGTLVYARTPALGSPSSLVWVDHDGRRRALIDDLRPFRFPRLSPDNQHLAVAIGAPGRSDIWVYDLDTDPPGGRRLTREGNNSVPVWTPDGTRVVFASNRDGPRNLFWMPADGSTVQPEPLLRSELPQHPLFVTSDSGEVVLYQNHPARFFDIWAFPTNGAQGRPVVQTPFFEGQGSLSPSGKWLAFTSDRDGDGYQVYVEPFLRNGGAVRISRDGGTEPAWSPDGRELYYTHAGKMMAVAIEEDEFTLRHGVPLELFDGFLYGGGPRSYDVARDGRFLVVVGNGDALPTNEVVVVLDWFGELEELVAGR